jgi:S1-C subfamily serine protease
LNALANTGGVLVYAVEPASPAAAAGVERGDIVVAYNDRPVTSIGALQRLLSEEQVGAPARLMLLRNLRKITVTVTPWESRPRRNLR